MQTTLETLGHRVTERDLERLAKINAALQSPFLSDPTKKRLRDEKREILEAREICQS